MEPLLHSAEFIYGAGGVLLTALLGCAAWRTCHVRREQRLANDLFWRDLADRVERERSGWA